MLFASAAAPKRTSVQADRWLIASSVTLNDALKRDSSPLGHVVRKHRHATHASVLWVMMGHQVIDVCIFVQEKKLLLFKGFQRKYRLMESEKRPFQFIRNKLWHRYFAVYCLCCLNISKNKLHWCNTQCCLLQSHCLVSSRNTLSLLLLRDESEQRLRGRIR